MKLFYFSGPQGGGNSRHTNPRNSRNPFQGYDDQQTQRPRYASGQYSNPADSSRSFNGDGWGLYRQNRGNQYNNGSDDTDRYTGDRFSNFGGPPQFSSGPHFNWNNSGSQFQPNQTFGNRNAPFPAQRPPFNGNNPRPWGQQQNNQCYGNQFEQNRIPSPPFKGNEPRQQFQQQSNASLGNQMTQGSTPLPQFNGNGPVQQQSNRFGNQLPNNQGFGNQQTINQGFRNQPPNIQGFGNQKPNNQGFGNQQPNNQGFGNQLQNNQGFGNQQGFENQRTNNQVFGNQQLNNQGFGNQQQNSKDLGIQQPNNHSFRNMNENDQPGIDYRGNGPRQQLPPETIQNYERKNEQILSSGSQTSWNGAGPQCQNNLSFGNVAGHRQLPNPPTSRPQFQQQNNPPVGIQTGQNLPLPNVQLNNDNPSRLTNQGSPGFLGPQGFMNNFRQQQPPSGSLSTGSSTSGRFPAPQVRGSMPNFR